MTHTYERSTANLLGALSLALAGAMQSAAAAMAGRGASAPAALVALAGPSGGATIEELRRILGLTHSGTVRLTDRLVASGLVERRLGPDARSVALHLTPPGRRTARRVLAARETALERVMAGLSAAQRWELDAALQAMLGQIDEPAARTCRLCDTTACPPGTTGCPRQISPSTRG